MRCCATSVSPNIILITQVYNYLFDSEIISTISLGAMIDLVKPSREKCLLLPVFSNMGINADIAICLHESNLGSSLSWQVNPDIWFERRV